MPGKLWKSVRDPQRAGAFGQVHSHQRTNGMRSCVQMASPCFKLCLSCFSAVCSLKAQYPFVTLGYLELKSSPVLGFKGLYRCSWLCVFCNVRSLRQEVGTQTHCTQCHMGLRALHGQDRGLWHCSLSHWKCSTSGMKKLGL